MMTTIGIIAHENAVLDVFDILDVMWANNDIAGNRCTAWEAIPVCSKVEITYRMTEYSYTCPAAAKSRPRTPCGMRLHRIEHMTQTETEAHSKVKSRINAMQELGPMPRVMVMCHVMMPMMRESRSRADEQNDDRDS